MCIQQIFLCKKFDIYGHYFKNLKFCRGTKTKKRDSMQHKNLYVSRNIFTIQMRDMFHIFFFSFEGRSENFYKKLHIYR